MWKVRPAFNAFCVGWIITAGLIAVPTAWAGDRALLIGTQRYADRRIPSLPGGEADADEMAALLRDGCGLSKEQIHVLHSADATCSRILRELDDWLVAGTGPGDRVVLYFSGHGSQAPDDNGDEEDGLDEILCPSDYDPVTQANMLRDDRLGEVLAKLDGRNVTVILDACHTGTAYKSIGGQICADPLYATNNVVPKYIPPPSGRPTTTSHPATTSAMVTKDDAGGGMVDSVTQNEVVFSACADDQRAEVARFREGKRRVVRSVFTWALLRGLSGRADQDGDGLISNAELLEFTQRELKRPGLDFTQMPILHCSELYRSQPVFGRTLALAGPARVFFARETQATINRGRYHDVRIGDRFLGIGGDGPDPIEVRVTSVSEFLSFGVASKDIHLKPPGLEVKPVVHLAPFENLSVFFGRFTDPTGKIVSLPSALRTAATSIDKVRIVSEESECDRIISGTVEPDGTMHVLMYGRYGRLQGQFTAVPLKAGAALAEWLQGQMLLEQLAALDNPAPPFRIVLSVKDGPERFFIYPEGDSRRQDIKLVITAEQDCYLLLLSIDSQGQVTLLLPNKWQQDTKIRARRPYIVPSPEAEFHLPIRLPPGHDVIKAIATRKPLDLHQVNAKGLNSQGFFHFEASELPALLDDIRTRGIGIEPVPGRPSGTGEVPISELPTTEWTTASLTVETVLP